MCSTIEANLIKYLEIFVDFWDPKKSLLGYFETDDSPKVRELYKGFEMIEVERQNGINNRQGADRQNKTYKELLIANYPIREIHNIGIEQNQIDESYTNFIL